MKYIKLLALSLMLLVSYAMVGLIDKANAASTVQPGDQIVAYYNTSEAAVTLVQMSNTDFVNALELHIQILDEACEEVNFAHTLTAGDTDIMELFDSGIEIDNADVPGIVVTPTQGLAIITVVDSPGSLVPASSGGNLAGTSWIIGVDDEPISHLFGAVHRTLGGNSEFELIQPSNILSPFNIADGEHSEFVAAAWTDVYPGGQYIATYGEAATDELLGLNIIDDSESKVSCLSFGVECVVAAGVTTALDSYLDIEPPAESYVCDKSTETYGLVDLNDITSTDNLIVLAGMFNDGEDQDGGMDYAITVDEQEVTPPAAEICTGGVDEDGDTLIDCADPDCAENIACAEGGAGSCSNATDDDADGDTDCADEDCDGVAGCEFETELTCGDNADNDADGDTDCDDADCAESAACAPEDGGGGGGGGGCSVAGSSIGLANALILLIPALGIAIRRRLIG